MFVRPRDSEMETWMPSRRARRREGDLRRRGRVRVGELPSKLWELLANAEELHYSLGLDEETDKLIARAIAHLRKTRRKASDRRAR